METLAAAWNGLLDELAELAPLTRGLVRPPRPSGEVEGVLGRLPVRVPDLVLAWFALHDGVAWGSPPVPTIAGSVLPFATPLSVHESVRDTLMIHEIWSASDDALEFDRQNPGDDPRRLHAGHSVGTWLDEYLLIAADGMGGGIFIDLRPGPLHGCLRNWDKVDADGYGDELVAESLPDLLGAVRAGLRTRAPVAGWVPTVNEGAIDWDVGYPLSPLQ